MRSPRGGSAVAQILPQGSRAAWPSLPSFPSFPAQAASFHPLSPTGCTFPRPEAKHSDPILDTFLSTLHFRTLIFFFFFSLFAGCCTPPLCSKSALLIGWGPVLLTPALVMSGLQLCQRPELALGARLDREDSVRWRVE